MGERFKRFVTGIALRAAERRAQREWDEFKEAPRLRVHLWPFGGQTRGYGPAPVFRSFIQINFHPRRSW